MGYVCLVQEKPAKWPVTGNLANTRYFLEVKLLHGQHFVHINELQRKFTITSTICTNAESCPTSVSHEKEMFRNGRVTSASKPLGIR